MTIAEFVNDLHGRGIDIRLENDRIKCSAPKGSLTQELAEEIKRRKPELLEFLKEALASGAPADPAINTVPRDRNLPLSVAQRSLWFAEQLMPGSHVQNLPSVFRLKGPLDLDAMERSLSEIISRHEVLRATISVENGEPVQVVTLPHRIILPVVDLSGPEPVDDEVFFSILRHDTKIPFDLIQGPLARMKLIRLSPHEHILFWMTHHMVWDGWSFDILLEELSTLYAAFSKGLPSPLPAMTIQYADYAVWQRKLLDSGDLDRQLDYWVRQLDGPRKSLDLPLDRPRPARPTRRGGRVRFDVPNALVARLKSLGSEEEATLFMVLLAAFEVMLCRYCGQEDLRVGCPMWGRTRPETEKLIGFFTNNVVLRADLSGAPSFREVLRRARKTSLDAHSNQTIPFEYIVERRPDANKSSFFDVLFSYQDARVRPLQMGDLKVTQLPAPSLDASPFDLLLWFKETQTELMSRLDFNADILDQSTMERFARHLRALLETIVDAPDDSISTLSFMNEAERRHMLVEWNATEKDFPRSGSVHELFEQQARRRPTSVAVEYAGKSLTYGELEKMSNRLARFLQECGAGPGQTVGICLGRSLATAETVLATLKTGAAYSPLDPDFPQHYLSFLIADAGMEIVVTDNSGAARLPSCEARIVSLDLDAAAIASCSEAKPEVAGYDPESTAFVMYTSCPTGTPRGVQVPHRAVVNFITSMAREPGLTENDAVAALAPLSSDYSVLELFLPLSFGAVIHIASRETANRGDLLMKFLLQHEATLVQAAPATWRMLLAAGWKGSQTVKILCGGGDFPQDLAKELQSRARGVWNMYGATETTVWSTCFRVTDPDKPVLIGKPVANTTVYVLDRTRQPVPVGVKGEMYVGGEGVACGYCNRPDLTEKNFIEDPLTKSAPARLYKTGDVAKFHPDGNIELLGRVDNQVRIEGLRVEPAEIESALADFNGVKSVVVTAFEAGGDEPRLIAYTVAHRGSFFTATELRKHLRSRVPEYKVPGHFVQLDEMPLDANGNPARDRLPIPEELAMESEARFTAPRSKEEAYLSGLWREMLGTNRVGIHDNFFELGGYSLLSMAALSRIEKETGHRLNPRVLLTDTLERIASTLASTPAVEPSAKSDNGVARTKGPDQASQPAKKGGLLTSALKKLWR